MHGHGDAQTQLQHLSSAGAALPASDTDRLDTSDTSNDECSHRSMLRHELPYISRRVREVSDPATWLASMFKIRADTVGLRVPSGLTLQPVDHIKNS